MEDPNSKQAMLDAFAKHGFDLKEAERLLQVNGGVIVHNTDMGSCIPGEIYQEIRSTLDDLDKKKPFDNDLTYANVNEIMHFESRKGNAMTQVLLCHFFDLPVRIVQVIAFEHDGESIKPIEPWELPQI